MTDWKAIRKQILLSKTPSVLEGLGWHGKLMRKALRRIVIDPGEKITIEQRYNRAAKKRDLDRKLGRELYQNVWMREIIPKLKKMHDIEVLKK